MSGLKRAFVLIGVKKTKTLPELEAVWDNINDVQDWANSQTNEKDAVVSITDEDEPVTIDRIYQTVSTFCDDGTIEQLVVYFSGHGINNLRSEYWLLSDAVENANAAVNVSGSVDLARYGVIPHVIFISDACRTAAPGIQAQSMTGGPIFPNKLGAGGSRYIDQFFGTEIGDACHEVQDVDEAVNGYRAVYTDALLQALNGGQAEILERSPDQTTDFVHPWPLHDYLYESVPIRLYELGVRDKFQRPDAVISSRSDAYVSALPADREPRILESGELSPEAIEFSETLKTESAFATEAFSSVLDDEGTSDITAIKNDIVRNVGVQKEGMGWISSEKQFFADNVSDSFDLFGVDSLPNQRGFKIRGTRIVEVVARDVEAKIDDGGAVVVFGTPGPPSQNVLLISESGFGVLFPSLEGYLVSLTFLDERLSDVNFVPDANSQRHRFYERKNSEIKRLRAVIAASSRSGRFRLREKDEKLSRRMQLGKGVDPSLALYAAHAYLEQGNVGWLEQMQRFLRNDLGVSLFDVALLASNPTRDFPMPEVQPLAPVLPMLSQSWPILQVRKYRLPPSLVGIEQHVATDSLWTVFNASGVELIRQSIIKGEV